MMKDLAAFRRLPSPLGLLIITQFVFNVGFYLVVPFLAAYLEEDLGVGVALIGLILGLRTFSQQGLFFLGGALADWLGVKPVLLVGIGIRVAGFLTLVFSRELPAIIVGVVLIGLAAALFSPASESAILGLARAAEETGGPRRTEILAMQQVASQAGSAVGPALGGVVLVVPFPSTCIVAAVLFIAVGIVHVFRLPSDLRIGARSSVWQSFGVVLWNRKFLVFAALNMIQLVAYNQMYLALPVEITRSGDGAGTITWYFLLASGLVITLQARITRLTDRWSATRVLQVSHLFTAAAFLSVAAVAWLPSPGGVLGVLPKVLLVVLLHIGFMAVQPRSRDIVGRLARERQLGAHLGVMASLGGLAVLVTGAPIGALLEQARTPGTAAIIPWLMLAGLALLVVVAARPVMRWVERGEPGLESFAAPAVPA